jgi:hypothetical protein
MGRKKRMGGFDLTKTTTLRYMSDQISLNPGVAGVTASHVFTGNGIYDPDITGTGHQPLGFDQWIGFYNHFTVTGFTMKVYFSNNSNNVPVFGGIKVSADGGSITNGQASIEQGNCKWTVMPPNDSGVVKTVTITQDNSKYFGKDVLKDRDFMGSSVGNPLEQLYPTIFAFPNSTTDVASVVAHVIIDYRVQFSEPKLVTQS